MSRLKLALLSPRQCHCSYGKRHRVLQLLLWLFSQHMVTTVKSAALCSDCCASGLCLSSAWSFHFRHGRRAHPPHDSLRHSSASLGSTLFRSGWHARLPSVEAMGPIHVDASGQGGQSTLTGEVAELLAELEGRGCCGCRGQRLHHDVVETLARIASDDAKWVLRQFETRLADGLSRRTAMALAEFIDKLLEASDT